MWQVQRAGQAHPESIIAESPPTPMSEFESGATSSPAAAAVAPPLGESAAAAVEASICRTFSRAPFARYETRPQEGEGLCEEKSSPGGGGGGAPLGPHSEARGGQSLPRGEAPPPGG